jgi:hypothetical protein
MTTATAWSTNRSSARRVRPGARSCSTLVAAVSALLLTAVGTPPAGATAPAAVCRPGDHRADPGLRAGVLAAPRPVPATDTRVHLVYEIILENLADRPVRLDRVVVCDPDRAKVVAAYDGSAVERLLFGFQAGTFTRTLGPGESGMLLADVELKAGARPPARLTHRFESSVRPASGPATTVGAPTRVDRRRALRVAPPLHGSNLGVFGCCGPPFAHRLALFDFDGRLFLAQRYAIDFVRLDDGLNTFAGDPARNESYFIFGDAVAAVAPGRVVAVRDGVPENTPPNPPANPGVDDLTGNFVIQRIGAGSYALYAHLQQGSVRVRAGDRLSRGQALGRVGNTGNSTEPHLHFQVTDGPGLPSGLAADGVPYVFDRFRLESRIAGLDGDPPALVRVPAPPPRHRSGQYPLTGDVVGFREATGLAAVGIPHCFWSRRAETSAGCAEGRTA